MVYFLARHRTADLLNIPIIPFFLCWILPTVVVFYLPLPKDVTSFQQNLIVFVFVGLYILLASSLTYRSIQYFLHKEPEEAWKYGFAVILIFLLVYFYAGFEGNIMIVTAGLSTANLLFAASIAGAMLASAIRRTAELVPVCLTAATADVMSVIKGPTRGMIEDMSVYYETGMTGSPPLVDFIVVKAGIPGYDIPLPLFGVTDWVLVALLSSSLLRLNTTENLVPEGLNGNGHVYLPVSAFALFICLVAAQITGIFLPAMLFIVVFFLSYLVLRLKVYRELKKSDIIYSFLFPAGVCSAILLI